jgi:hypothetical protein
LCIRSNGSSPRSSTLIPISRIKILDEIQTFGVMVAKGQKSRHVPQLGQNNLGNKLGVHLRWEMKCYQTKWKNVGGKGKDSSHLQGALGIHKEL